MTPSRLQLATLVLALAAVLGMAPAQDPTVAARQTAFLKQVREGKIEEAYDALLEGSLVREKKADVENLVTQTEKALGLYGGVTELEDLGASRQDKHVAHGTAIVCCEKGPLYFYFIWYRPKSDAAWRIQNVWFDDNARAFMEKSR